MIKSVIFDIGRVLLRFEPKDYLYKLYGRGEKSERLYNIVFGSKTWLDLDRGTVSYDDAIKIMASECNSLSREIEYLIHNWIEIMTPIEESINLLKEIKTKGYNTFVLSNYHKEAFETVYSKYDFFRLFDGMFISSHYGLLKPEKEIYEKMLQKFSLNPTECFFIDDTPVNISASKELGIEGVVFKNPQLLRQDLRSLNIL
ncbi:MAG: HAD family phosphatase [Clostridiaceae bacterium]|jgi:epoxide hydrolase-like predicted phosphatase|nr:HAD family phosphatase [Clostridiaceae bacterium]